MLKDTKNNNKVIGLSNRKNKSKLKIDKIKKQDRGQFICDSILMGKQKLITRMYTYLGNRGEWWWV